MDDRLILVNNNPSQEDTMRTIQNQRHQDRTQRRQPRPPGRRQGTRAAVIRHAMQEA